MSRLQTASSRIFRNDSLGQRSWVWLNIDDVIVAFCEHCHHHCCCCSSSSLFWFVLISKINLIVVLFLFHVLTMFLMLLMMLRDMLWWSDRYVCSFFCIEKTTWDLRQNWKKGSADWTPTSICHEHFNDLPMRKQVVQHLKKSQTFIHGIHGPWYVLNIPAAKPIKRRDPHKQLKKATSNKSVGFLYHKGSLHLWKKNSEGINSYRHQFHQQKWPKLLASPQHRLKIQKNHWHSTLGQKNAPIAQANEPMFFYF